VNKVGEMSPDIPSLVLSSTPRRLSENSDFFKIKAYKKNYRRHIVDIPRIIF